jgi:hypothetical protein
LLRQAVNYGYQEGFRAGEADRQDRWRSNYRDSYAYQDANYGYNGYYVDRGDYNYYFREGFRRGYEDGTAASIGMAAILMAHIAYLMPSCRKSSASSRFAKEIERLAD